MNNKKYEMPHIPCLLVVTALLFAGAELEGFPYIGTLVS
jgi:hypothetical protein